MGAMTEPATRHIVFLGPPGELPDSWTGVINELPKNVKPWLPNLAGAPVANIEALLDKQELRSVEIVAYGAGAVAASLFTARQPHRVRALVLVDPVLGMDEKAQKQARRTLRFLPGFLLRRRGLDKQELIAGIDSAAAEVRGITAPVTVVGQGDQAQAAAEVLGVSTQAGGADYRTAPREFVAAAVGPLRN